MRAPRQVRLKGPEHLLLHWVVDTWARGTRPRDWPRPSRDDWVRVLTILLAIQGWRNQAIAQALSVGPSHISRLRKQAARHGFIDALSHVTNDALALTWLAEPWPALVSLLARAEAMRGVRQMRNTPPYSEWPVRGFALPVSGPYSPHVPWVHEVLHDTFFHEPPARRGWTSRTLCSFIQREREHQRAQLEAGNQGDTASKVTLKPAPDQMAISRVWAAWDLGPTVRRSLRPLRRPRDEQTSMTLVGLFFSPRVGIAAFARLHEELGPVSWQGRFREDAECCRPTLGLLWLLRYIEGLRRAASRKPQGEREEVVEFLARVSAWGSASEKVSLYFTGSGLAKALGMPQDFVEWLPVRSTGAPLPGATLLARRARALLLRRGRPDGAWQKRAADSATDAAKAYFLELLRVREQEPPPRRFPPFSWVLPSGSQGLHYYS